MNRFRTLNRSHLLALPFAALLVACGAQPATESDLAGAAGNENEAPVEIVDNGEPDQVVDGPEHVNEDGSPIAENGKIEVDGVEADGPDFVSSEEPAPEVHEDGIGQSTDALTTSSRRLWVYNEAKRETEWLNKSTSYYTHATYMNESTGTRRTDCSGFIAYAFNRVLPVSYDRVNDATYGTSVKSADWYDYLMGRPTSASTDLSKSRFRKITKITDLRQGDILVWKNPSWMENTGHTMIVRGTPRAGRASRNEILVPIYDATSGSHSYDGAWDSRGTSGTGIGAGTVGIKVDSYGKGVAYYWTGGKSGTAIYRPMVGGRIE